MSYRFTTVITHEGKWYVARCVELGVVSQGKTIDQAGTNLREAVELYLEDQPKSARQQFHTRQAPIITMMDVDYA